MARRGNNKSEIDIVIPYKRTHDELELRYALRSISENFQKVGRVYLVGDKPEWVRNVEYIPNTNKDHKRINVGYALRMAMWRDELSKEFLIWNDDMFLLEPLEEIPLWHGKSLKEFGALYNSRYPQSYYTKKIHQTTAKSDLPHFELHIPILVDKEKLMEQIGDHPPERSYLMRTHYALNNTDPSKWEYHEDVKIHSYSGSKGWQEKERFKTFVSSADNTFLGVIYPVLKELFPNKSRYEI